MPAVPLALMACKAGASGGFACVALDFVSQLCRKKLCKDEDDREAISAEEMIKAWGVGLVLGNVVGTSLVGNFRHAHIGKTLAAMAGSELLWMPVHFMQVLGYSEKMAENVPRLFGYTVFACAGGTIFCDVCIHFIHLHHHQITYYRHVREAIIAVGSSICGSILLVFTNRFCDLQRNKTILHKSTTVVTVHTLANTAGQVLGTLTACNLALTVWIVRMPVWWFPSMIVAPAFFFCTALNIENGVQSAEINGRTEPTQEQRAETQKRHSILQTLPLGALPSGFAKGHKVHSAVLLGLKILAAACASTYIAYMQAPWSKYLMIEKGQYKRVERVSLDTPWAIDWKTLGRDEDGDKCLCLDQVDPKGPAKALRTMSGRVLFRVNDQDVVDLAGWEEVSSSALILHLDFHQQMTEEERQDHMLPDCCQRFGSNKKVSPDPP
eukprot:Hpha_TRINITY_DN26049_c0_g1::TRINITY_DN26049_c0_g1_i1::g.115259::m.115259